MYPVQLNYLTRIYNVVFFFFNDTATTEIYTLSLHDALPIARLGHVHGGHVLRRGLMRQPQHAPAVAGELDAHAFANVPEAVELVVAQEPHVLGKIGLCHGDPSRLGMVPSSRVGVTDRTCGGVARGGSNEERASSGRADGGGARRG